MDPNDNRKKIEETNKNRAAQEREIDDKVRLFQRAYDSFPDEASKNLLAGGPAGQAHQLLEKNNFKNPEEIIEARGFWSNYKDTAAEKEITTPKEETPVSTASKSPPGSTAVMLGVVGAGAVYDRLKDRKYNKFKKEADEYAKEKVEEWKSSQDPTFARSEKGAYNHAYNNFHDNFLKDNPKKAIRWAEQHEDKALQKAIKKKEVLDKPNPKRDWRETERFMDKKDIKHPEKTHRPKGDMSQETADKKLAAAAVIGATKTSTPNARQEQASRVLEAAAEEGAKQNATPESAADHLREVDEGRDQEVGLSDFEKRIKAAKESAEPSDLEKRMAAAREEGERTKELSPEDVAKKLEEQTGTEKEKNKDEEKKIVVPREPKTPRTQNAGQPITRKTITTTTQRRTPAGRMTYPFRRSARARRRYGGIFGGRMGRGAATKGAKRGAARAGSLILTNPWVLIGATIGVVVLVFILLLIAWIRSACDNFWDDPLGNIIPASIGLYTGICSNTADGLEIVIPDNPPGVTTDKEGPREIGNGQDIAYGITVRFSPGSNSITEGTFSSLYLYDVPLFAFDPGARSEGAEILTGSDERRYVRWPISSNPDCVDKYECFFELTVNPNQIDFIAKNVVYVSDEYQEVEVIASQQSIEAAPTVSSGRGVRACGSREKGDIWRGADCLPTNDTCGGKWSNQMFGTDAKKGTKEIVEEHIREGRLDGARGNGYNFGDPLCTFKFFKVEAVIDELIRDGLETKARGEFWKDIAYCEGTPNSFGAQALDPGDTRPMGPAGYFQMNIGTPYVFKKWQPDKPIRGDVPWQRQIQNAIKYNNDALKNKDYAFWGGAYCLCSYPGYRSKGYCQYILNEGLNRPVGSCNDKCQERGERGPVL